MSLSTYLITTAKVACFVFFGLIGIAALLVLMIYTQRNINGESREMYHQWQKGRHHEAIQDQIDTAKQEQTKA